MVNGVDEIPWNVQSAIRVRFECVKQLQRIKRMHVRVYGLQRGLYEHNCPPTLEKRRAAARDWRYVRDRIMQQRLETRCVVKLIKQEEFAL